MHKKSRMEKRNLEAQSQQFLRRKYNIKEKDLNAQSGEVSRC